MSAICEFDSEKFGTLTVYRDESNREYFRAIDVCSILRHSNPNQALKRFVDEDYIFQFKEEINRSQTANYLSEPGLYQLIFASKTEWAKQFQRWVFEEVLPKLRTSGGYIMPTATSEQLEALREEIDLQIEQLRSQVNRVLGCSGSAYMSARDFARRIYLRDPSLNTAKNEKKGYYPAKCRDHMVNRFWNEFVDGFLCPGDVRNSRFQWLCLEIGFKPNWFQSTFGLQSQFSGDAQFPIWLMVWHLENMFEPERSQRFERTEYDRDFVKANRVLPEDLKMPSFKEITDRLWQNHRLQSEAVDNGCN